MAKDPNARSEIAIPFPDESIIANLDNIISMFKARDVNNNKNPSQEDLQQTLDDLANVKAALEKINVESAKMKEFVEESSLEISLSEPEKDETIEMSPVNQEVRNSLEMLKNGGKFTKPIDQTNLQKKRENPPSDTINRKSKEISNNNSNRPTWSFTSLRDSMTITPLPVTRRKSPPNHKLLSRKVSQQTLLKKAERKAKNSSKQARNSELNKPRTTSTGLEVSSPKILSTRIATCRIHSYEDKSHTFEIMRPNLANGQGDSNEKSEIVVVVLANGQTALFTTKSGANILSFGESQ